MHTNIFDFDLPEELIALRPVEPRGSARLLHVRPDAEPAFADLRVADLPALMRKGDVLVLNDTKVIPALLKGERLRGGPGGCSLSFTVHRRLNDGRWLAFAKPGRRIQAGDAIALNGDSEARIRVDAKGDAGEVTLSTACGISLDTLIDTFGITPLPPYIASRREPDARDTEDYQTLFAAKRGAIAAPTAGLHMTAEMLAELERRGIPHVFVTLHVGAGTFLPVKAERTEDHIMHTERGEITAETAAKLNTARNNGGRIVACGTTALRVLESAASSDGLIQPFASETGIFITPGYRFRAVDALMTNFHLPRSTLFMLVSAFSGLDLMQRAYAHAISNGYRFYSYGDSSFLEQAAP
jgi:S-adenosylmethionine:tRNA ribosyltransferase-isomerase